MCEFMQIHVVTHVCHACAGPSTPLESSTVSGAPKAAHLRLAQC